MIPIPWGGEVEKEQGREEMKSEDNCRSNIRMYDNENSS